MFIAKYEINKKWFDILFPWIERCENSFKKNSLIGCYIQKLNIFFIGKYLFFWFKKYIKYKLQP
jgi:hypothetical protein